MIRSLISILFFVGCVYTSIAQECTASLRGTVLDEKGMPMPHAAVTLRETNTQSISDVDGAFGFDRLCPGDITIALQTGPSIFKPVIDGLRGFKWSATWIDHHRQLVRLSPEIVQRL